jgi:AcrR family transcriptional regulator
MPRLSRAERKENTTAQLLQTAKTVFTERGYHRSRLDDIADAAGFTTGAVYARFQSKDELMLALLEQRNEEIVRESAEDLSHCRTFEQFVRTEARRLIEYRRDNAKWYLLLLEFWTYAASDPDLRREFAARHNALVESVAARIGQAAEHFGVKLKVRPIDMARVGSAMSVGYTLERLADPVGVPDTLLESMFALLASDALLQSKKSKPTNSSVRARASAGAGRRKSNGSAKHATNAKNAR